MDNYKTLYHKMFIELENLINADEAPTKADLIDIQNLCEDIYMDLDDSSEKE